MHIADIKNLIVFIIHVMTGVIDRYNGRTEGRKTVNWHSLYLPIYMDITHSTLFGHKIKTATEYSRYIIWNKVEVYDLTSLLYRSNT